MSKTANQDMPPSSGFPTTIKYQRYLPARGPSGAFLFSVITGITIYGFYELSLIKNEERQLKNEKMWARIYLAPILQAETDRDLVRKHAVLVKKEADIMKNTPEWAAGDLKKPMAGLSSLGDVPVYYTERYIAPTILFIAPNDESFMPAQEWRTSKWFGIKNSPFHERWDWIHKKNGPPVVIED